MQKCKDLLKSVKLYIYRSMHSFMLAHFLHIIEMIAFDVKITHVKGIKNISVESISVIQTLYLFLMK